MLPASLGVRCSIHLSLQLYGVPINSMACEDTVYLAAGVTVLWFHRLYCEVDCLAYLINTSWVVTSRVPIRVGLMAKRVVTAYIHGLLLEL